MAVNPTTWTRDTFIHEYRHAAARGENFSCNEDFYFPYPHYFGNFLYSIYTTPHKEDV